MPSALLWATLARWLDSVAVALVLGGLSFDLLVLPRGPGELAQVRERLRRIILVAGAILVAASFAELVGRAATMAGDGLATALAALPVVLGKTHFGTIWTVRAAAIAALLVCTASSQRLRLVALAAAIAVAATTALTGHAADWGDLRPIAFSDWLHVVASGAWTGGLFCLAFAVLRRADAPPPNAVALGDVARRFSRLAGACVCLILLTGVANAWVQIADLSALWQTTYGRILAVKLVCVAGLIGLGAANRYFVLPTLSPSRPPAAVIPDAAADWTAARRAFSRYVVAEVGLATLIFACTALLGQVAPPRHDPSMHGHADRPGGEAAVGCLVIPEKYL